MLFKSLFNGDRVLWFFVWIFHAVLALIILGHLRVFTNVDAILRAVGMSEENIQAMSAGAGGAAGVVILVAVGDRREREMPKVGLIELVDNETGQRVVVDTQSPRWRQRYRRRREQEAEERARQLRRYRLDCISVNTGESFVEPLTKYFRAREARW